jgi:lysophospholipase L1-like esterase
MTRHATHGNGAWWVFTLVTGMLWLGFVLHSSGGAGLVLGKYSPAYAAFLALSTAGWLGALILAWRRKTQLPALLKSSLGSIGITLIIAALILPPAYLYLYRRYLDAEVFTTVDAKAHSFFQIEQAPEPPAAEDALRVLCLGGSSTYGPRLERDQTYPALLEKKLSAQLGRKVSVHNAGVPWHTSLHSLLRYVTRLDDWKPHVVIVMHSFNDIFQASEGRLTSGHFRDDYGHFFGALGERVNREDRFNARLGAVLGEHWLMRTWYSDLRPAHAPKAMGRVDLLKPLPAYRRHLGELMRRIRQDGAHAILLTEPYLYRNDLSAADRKNLFYGYYYRDYAQVPAIAEQRAAMDRFNAAALEVARTAGATAYDLEAALPNSPEFLYDDVHYTIVGAKRVAELIADQIPWKEMTTNDTP